MRRSQKYITRSGSAEPPGPPGRGGPRALSPRVRARRRCGGARLPERIGAVGVARLLREPGAWQLGEPPDLVGDVPQERDELTRLGRVQRGEDEKRPSG